MKQTTMFSIDSVHALFFCNALYVLLVENTSLFVEYFAAAIYGILILPFNSMFKCSCRLNLLLCVSNFVPKNLSKISHK